MGKDGFGRYPVQDRELLKGLVLQLVNHYGQGSVNKAAKEIEISQPTLYRLYEGLSGYVSQGTMRQLEKAVLKMNHRLQEQLPLAVMSTAALRLYRRGFSKWCRERSLRLIRRRGQTWARLRHKPPRPVREPWRANSIDADLNTTFEEARTECPDIFDRLHRFVVRKGIPEERYKVAVVRMVEPLAESSASAFFEPRWIDLTHRQRRQFLEAGRRREEILMSGKHPQIRANLLAAGLDPVGDELYSKISQE